MATPEKAGAAYFAIVFAFGFVLGSVRVLGVEGLTGEVIAVALELPIMLLVCWFVAGWLVARLAVSPDTGHRLRMGAVALVLLLLAEAMLAMAFGRTLSAHLASYATMRGGLTLLGQFGFAAMPLLVGPRDA